MATMMMEDPNTSVEAAAPTTIMSQDTTETTTTDDSHNDSDLENCTENKAPMPQQKLDNNNNNNSGREGNVLGTSQRTNCHDDDTGGDKKENTNNSSSSTANKSTTTSSSPAVVILPQTEKHNDEEEISETEALSVTEGPEQEALEEVSSSSISPVDTTVSTRESLASADEEEAYKNDCKDYLLQLTTNTTTASASAMTLLSAEVNDNNEEEAAKDELSIEHAPSDEQAFLDKDAQMDKAEDDDEATEKPIDKEPEHTESNQAVASESTITATESTIEFCEKEDELVEQSAKSFGKRNSFGSRYKSGMITGLSLESNKSGAFPKPNVEKPPRTSVGSRVAQIMQSPEINSVTAKVASPRVSSPNLNTRNLLKMYNKDLYYSNELCYLLCVDPAGTNRGILNFEEIAKIVADCPSVCRTKYVLPFDGKKINVYPLFSLVAHGAPRELVETVFTLNPFMFLDVRDTQGQTLMHYALRYTPPSVETLKFLIHRSSHSLDSCDYMNRSPLHTVCAYNAAATEIVQFIANESPKHVLAVPDEQGNLPIHLCLNSMDCSYAIIKDLTDRYPEALASRTASNQLALQLAQEQTLQDDIQGYILEHTPACDVTAESFSVALRTAKYSSALPLIQRLVEEDPSILTKVDQGKIPLEIAHCHGASKAVMQYLYQKTPNRMIPKWLAKVRPTENEVRQALKEEAEEKAKTMTMTQQKATTAGVVDNGTDDGKSKTGAGTSAVTEQGIGNGTDILVPTPSFWERLCCKPRVVLD